MSQIENVLQENRKFPPSPEFRRESRLNDEAVYQRMYAESLRDPEAFWGRVAREIPWIAPWSKVLDWSNAPFAKWFVGGKLNASAVCLDQHIESLRGGRRALVWEGEPGDVRTLTYTELHVEVCRFANALKARGLKKGDRVAIYLPMIPEAMIAMLACARIGAAHSVIFAGFAANAVRDRVLDGRCTAVITADGSWRRGSVLDLKVNVDDALKECPDVKTVVVVRRAENRVNWTKGRDFWFHELVAEASADCAPEPMDSEDLLYLLYTSGSTGKPKGIMHTTGGYMVGTYMTAQYVFDLREDDVYWCTADIGWVTGHSYVVYGPLANGATVMMYEGA
ncbi:MAG: AMP-binding protein, partial [Planctomycetes bacterium]|nr:AMP-binding protein [Planctomycetota bacterium]